MNIDPGTGLAILGGALASKEFLVKLLGPTADYIGDGVKNWTERRVNNVGTIFSIACNALFTSISAFLTNFSLLSPVPMVDTLELCGLPAIIFPLLVFFFCYVSELRFDFYFMKICFNIAITKNPL